MAYFAKFEPDIKLEPLIEPWSTEEQEEEEEDARNVSKHRLNGGKLPLQRYQYLQIT